MEILIIALVVMLGFILLVSNSLRKKNMADVLLFSILLVLSGLSFTLIGEEGLILYFGVFLSVIGFLIGTVRFFMKEFE